MLPRLLRSALHRVRISGLVSESIWGLVVELTTLTGTLLSFIMLGRSLGAAGYGGYASLYAIVGPLVTLAASGSVLAILQHVVRDGEPLASTARSCLSLSLGLGVLLTLIGTVAGTAIVDSVELVAIVAILATEFLAVPLVQVAAGTVQAGTGFIPASRIRLVLLSARIVVIVGLFVAGALTVTTLGVTMFSVATVLGLLSLRSVGRRYDFAFVPGSFQLRHLKTNVLYSTGSSASSLNSDGDKLVLAASGYAVETGQYAAAYRIVSFGLIPVTSLMQVSHNRFLVHIEGLRGQHLRRSLKFGLLAGIYGVVFGVLLYVAAPLLPLLMGEEFEGSVVMVQWLAPIVCLRSLATFGLNGLMGLDKMALRTALVVANAMFAVVLYIVLIPGVGWEGAAIGTLISESLLVVSTWTALVVCQRRSDARLPPQAQSAIDGRS